MLVQHQQSTCRSVTESSMNWCRSEHFGGHSASAAELLTLVAVQALAWGACKTCAIKHLVLPQAGISSFLAILWLSRQHH